MRTLVLILALCFFSGQVYSENYDIESYSGIVEPKRPENIQVLIEKDINEALLEVKGPYYIFNPFDGTRISSGLLGKRFMIHPIEKGLKWGEAFPGIYQILLVPRSPETSILINGTQYEGSVAVFQIDNNISIVNDVDIESYLKSILPTRFSYPLENEVMAAVAILARTEAYFHVARNRASFWHIEASDVGYQGTTFIVPSSTITKSVDATRHLILVNPQNGRNLPFATEWTEHSAGKTAAYEKIFRKEGFTSKTGVKALHAAIDREESRWSFQISREELADLIHVDDVTGIELFVDQSSGKSYAIRIKAGDHVHDIDFFSFQDRVGKDRLKSNDFQVSLKDRSVYFTGYGQGHGVGLCLYSASAMAQNGDNAIKILSKFFPDTFLLNLSAAPSKRKIVQEAEKEHAVD